VPYAILGAGVAGLTAALKLLDEGVPGRDITIFEAQERTGGRVQSIPLSEGTVIERGAAWFHPDDNGHNPFMNFLVKRYGADLATIIPENPGPCTVVTKHGFETVPFFDEDIDNRLRDEFNNFRLGNPDSDISLLALARRIKDKDRGRAMIHIRRLAENYMGSAHEYKSSAEEVFTDPYGDGGPQVQEGLERYIHAMTTELKTRGVTVQLGTKISSLGEDEKGALLIDKNGAAQPCETLICTLPVPVLKSMIPVMGTLIPSRLRKYLNGIQTSHFTKIIVPVQEAFLTGRFSQDAAIINTVSDRFTEISILPAGKPVVVMFATGDTAIRWEGLGKADLLKTVRQVFDKLPALAGYTAAIRADEISVTDWNTNPLFKGSYGAMKVGNTRKGPMSSKQGAIIFAGTEFHPVAGGSMATAYESGAIAAQMALERGYANNPELRRERSPRSAYDTTDTEPAGPAPEPF
jgi:monoamine oxidase